MLVAVPLVVVASSTIARSALVPVGPWPRRVLVAATAKRSWPPTTASVVAGAGIAQRRIAMTGRAPASVRFSCRCYGARRELWPVSLARTRASKRSPTPSPSTKITSAARISGWNDESPIQSMIAVPGAMASTAISAA